MSIKETINSPKKLIGAVAKFTIISVVLVFLGVQSLNFFEYIFPADEWYLAYLGFGLTSGGVVLYLVIFNNDAETKLQKTVAVTMLLISVIGEILTAGFGMNIEAMSKAGFELTEADFSFMVIAVQALGFIHGIANLIYISGDKIAELFGDEDGDGIPNIIDPDYKPKQKQMKRAFAEDVKKEQSKK